MATTSLDKRSVYVVVLGDIGRSPRMCNHAVSLAGEGFNVSLVGYDESTVKSQVADNDAIRIVKVPPYPTVVRRWGLPRLLNYFLKAIWQAITLWMAFPSWSAPDYLLLQNPPGMPALLVCYAYSLLHRRTTRFVIDWHNYGFSILAMSLGGDHRHPLVRLTKRVEMFAASTVDGAFCVSNAMERDLRRNFGAANPITLYDRAPNSFRPTIPASQSRDLFARLSVEHPEFAAFARDDDGEGRPALVVSSTSWTEDEDFSLLVEALQSYEEARERGDVPPLLCAITGKGPLKSFYGNLIRRRRWKHVKVITPWLRPDDYPKLLASADLGVCLHTSSSGVDLPMKVVDMFGCGLPVLAKRFPALCELVRDGKNGKHFVTSEELGRHLVEWFADFADPAYRRRCAQYRDRVLEFGKERWDETWRKVAKPLFCP